MTSQPEDSPSRTGPAGSVPESAVSEAAEVGKSAAKQVVPETGAQARHLFEQGVDQLREQASGGQHKLAGGLRWLADQLRRLSDRTDGSGMAVDLIQQGSDRLSDAASWLDSREPGDLVHEVRRFARQWPGMFLAGVAVAGVVVGRLTRNVVASSTSAEPDTGQHQVTPTASPHTAAAVPPVGDEPRRQQVVPAGQYGTNPVLP